MTTEDKALALVEEVTFERGERRYISLARMGDAKVEALCRAIEQHEAFRQEVSDECIVLGFKPALIGIGRFIIPAPKPDPLVTATLQVFPDNPFAKEHSDRIRAALDALGFEIREKNND